MKKNRYDFFGMIHRMHSIKRWSLMRNRIDENVAEHCFDVAIIAHTLYQIRKYEFTDALLPPLEKVLLYGLYHDAPEIITGDLPTPVKYYNTEIRDSFKKIEDQAIARMVSLLPKEWQEDYAKILDEHPKDDEDAIARLFVKAADKISAYLKCLCEINAGNKEFGPACESTKQIIDALDLPEIQYFMDHFAASYTLPLDELKEGDKT